MRRTLATTGAALVIAAAAAGPAAATPVYPPTPTGEVQPSVQPSAEPSRPVLTQNAAVDSLAFTGTDVAVVGGAAALLVVGGVVLVRVARRRGEHLA